MRHLVTAAAAALLSFGPREAPPAPPCADDSVAAGIVCIDKYEASVWYVPSGQKALINRIQQGRATADDLADGFAIQVGLAPQDLAFYGCPPTGAGCLNVYAVSIPGVMPAGYINWLQAAATARNSLKRLPTNQEWQVSALGTPDGAPCNIALSGQVAATGSAAGCVSDVGAFDMVGNVMELVAEWALTSQGCFHWPQDFGSDLACGNVPTMAIRGGSVGIFGGTDAGVFALRANLHAHIGSPAGLLGFRAAR